MGTLAIDSVEVDRNIEGLENFIKEFLGGKVIC